MKVTKANCVFALAGLYGAADGEHDEENKDTLQELINEYFDNPSLKFDDLKEGMPIWDSVEKCWIYIVHIARDYSNNLFTYVWWCDKNNDYYIEPLIEFEENRFYRKEVMVNE